MYGNARKNRPSSSAAAIEQHITKGVEQSTGQQKLAHTIPQAVQASGLSRSMLYLAIGRGELQARKCGARTVILDDDLRRFLSRLPRFASTAAMPKAAP
ncbi:MAG: hypothetical protein KGK33_07455 [Hyphomicrobiales bacterium]|nr:hypothetical protein [Hyphomicrobiales bacterium]